MISSRTGPTHFDIILEAQLFEQSRSAKACLCQATRSAASLPTAPGTSIGSKLQPFAHGKLTLDQGNGHALALALGLGLGLGLALAFALLLVARLGLGLGSGLCGSLATGSLATLGLVLLRFRLLVVRPERLRSLGAIFLLVLLLVEGIRDGGGICQDLLFQVDLERLGLVTLHRRVRGWGRCWCRCRWGRCWGGSSTRRCSGLGIHQGLLLSRSG